MHDMNHEWLFIFSKRNCPELNSTTRGKFWRAFFSSRPEEFAHPNVTIRWNFHFQNDQVARKFSYNANLVGRDGEIDFIQIVFSFSVYLPSFLKYLYRHFFGWSGWLVKKWLGRYHTLQSQARQRNSGSLGWRTDFTRFDFRFDPILSTRCTAAILYQSWCFRSCSMRNCFLKSL